MQNDKMMIDLLTEHFCVILGDFERQFEVERQHQYITIKYYEDLFKLNGQLKIQNAMQYKNNYLKFDDLILNQAKGLDEHYMVFKIQNAVIKYLVFKRGSNFYFAYEKDYLEIKPCLEQFFDLNKEMLVNKYEELKSELFSKVNPVGQRESVSSFRIDNPEMNHMMDNSNDQSVSIQIDPDNFVKASFRIDNPKMNHIQDNSNFQNVSIQDNPDSFFRPSLIIDNPEMNHIMDDSNDWTVSIQIDPDPVRPSSIIDNPEMNHMMDNSNDRSVSVQIDPDNLVIVQNEEVQNLDNPKYHIFIGGENYDMKQLCSETGEVLKNYGEPGQGFILCMVKSPDNLKQFTGDGNGCIIEWDVPEREEVTNYGKVHEQNLTIIISPDGKKLITGGSEGRLKVQYVENQPVLRDFNLFVTQQTTSTKNQKFILILCPFLLWFPHRDSLINQDSFSFFSIFLDFII